MTSLFDVWERLETGGDRIGSHVRLRLSDQRIPAVYVGKKIPDGFETLIMEVETSCLPADVDYPESAGFSVLADPIVPGPSGRTRILLELATPRFRDIFLALVEDLVPRLLAVSADTEAVKTLLTRLNRWQAFLRKHGPGGLSLEARRGLFGELWFAARHLAPALGPQASFTAWKGPSGANQDFQFSAASIEVKSTAATTPHSFRVSNIRQLDDAGLPALWVHLVILEENDGARTSLPELVDESRLLLGDAGVERLEDALLNVGFVERQRQHYDRPRYSVRRERTFQVESGFPRMLESQLPAGIEDVEYAVALAACAPFERTLPDILSTLTVGNRT